MAGSTLFLTGRLALPSLTRTLAETDDLGFDYEIRDLGLQVAGLMTASMIERRLGSKIDADRIIVPGLCSGDLTQLSEKIATTIVKGPVDLKDLPEFFGADAKTRNLDTYDIDIFAEIVDAPTLDETTLLARASAYRDDGADVIDLGCLPGQKFDHLEASVRLLKAHGFRVSVDSLESDELLRGGKAGADYLLSLKKSTLWIAEEVDAIPVLIPESPDDMASLYEAIKQCEKSGRQYYADPILNPIMFGMTESLLRYHSLKTEFPQARLFMGIGNVTELTDAETSGMTAILCGIATELGVKAVLTTEVSDHARTVVRETDLARRIMFAAREDASLPRNYDRGLMTTHEKKPFPSSPAEIKDIAGAIRDPSYRIQVADNGLNIYNRDGIHTSTNPYDLFPKLNIDTDGSHAFYLGVELSRAQIAFELGKRYTQDRPLDWGVAGLPPEFDEASHEYAKPGATLKAKKRQHRKAPKTREKENGENDS